MFDIPLLKIITQLIPNFSIIHNPQPNTTSIHNPHITPSSIAACKSIGSIATDKIHHVLFNSCSSKTLIHKHVVPHNYTSIYSYDDHWILSLASSIVSSNLVALNKIWFPEFNRNIVVDDHPALIIDSTNLWYDIIFGCDSLDKCRITLDYDCNQVHWMEYIIPVCDTVDFFIQLLLLPSCATQDSFWRWPLWQSSNWLLCDKNPWCKIQTG